VGWLGLVFLLDPVRFVVFNPRAKTGFEVFLAISQLFGALILALTPATDDLRWRLRWVAAGFLLLGAGALGFGYLYPLLTDTPHLGVTMYGSLYVQAVSATLVAIGLVPAVPPRMRRVHAVGLAVIVGLGGIAMAAVAIHLPPLVRIGGMGDIIDHDAAADAGSIIRHVHLVDLERVVSNARTVFPGLTAWHWGASLIPLAAALTAVWGAWVQHRRRPLSTWLLVAVVLFAGAQLHSLFWPSMYSSIMTTTSMLRVGMAAVIITGGILEFRRLVEERAVLLAGERERVARLEELAALKSDFTSIVAHELASPMVAITTMGEMLATGSLSTDQSEQIGVQIVGEAHLLRLLVMDMRASAEIERDDFGVQPRPISVTSVFASAEAYASTLPETHLITFDPAPR
jgi:cytochrome bd-type quinol oxidase subunit 2